MPMYRQSESEKQRLASFSALGISSGKNRICCPYFLSWKVRYSANCVHYILKIPRSGFNLLHSKSVWLTNSKMMKISNYFNLIRLSVTVTPFTAELLTTNFNLLTAEFLLLTADLICWKFEIFADCWHCLLTAKFKMLTSNKLLCT